MDTFRFRLNCIDHYQATPTDLDPLLRRSTGSTQRQGAPSVPVIRAFGATESGQKVCAHIHGALPYLYLEYDGSLNKEDVDSYMLTLRGSIDQALAAAYRRNTYDGKAVYVGHITLVKGVPFYGYNVGYKIFLKVYLLNPLHMTRFADLLHQGAILNRVFQPYESHLQYILQWMCDYNLYGCAYVNCAKVQFRKPVPASDETDTTSHKWHDASIPSSAVTETDQYPRQSHCTLEVDICVQDILNRHELRVRSIHHDFLERSNMSNIDDKFVPSMASLWKDETRRRKLRMGLTDPSSSPFPPEVLISMSADTQADKGGWMHEEEYRQIVDELIREERGGGPAPSFETFIKQFEGSELVQTAVQSVEDLYPNNLRRQIQWEDPDVDEDLQTIHEGVKHPEIDTPFEVKETTMGLVDEENEIDTETGPNAENPPSLDPLSAYESQLWDLRIQSNENSEYDGSNEGTGVEVEQEGLHNTSGTRKRQSDAEYKDSGKRQRPIADDLPDTLGNYIPMQDTNDGHVRSTQLSQGSIKAEGNSGPTTLAFPVVKNPNAPETIFRLSQTGYSNSQEGLATPANKSSTIHSSEVSSFTLCSHPKQASLKYQHGSSNAFTETRTVVKQLSKTFHNAPHTYYYGHLPPTIDMVENTLEKANLPRVIYQDAYYSNELDVPERPREYAGREFRLQSATLPYLPEFDPTSTSLANFGLHPPITLDKSKEESRSRYRSQRCSLRHWESALLPPTYLDVDTWLQAKHREVADKKQRAKSQIETNTLSEGLSQVEGPTQKNKHGFKYSQNPRSASVKHETQYMSILSLEVHANSRGSLVPDPAEDEIQCIFWCIEGEEGPATGHSRTGVLCLSNEDGIADRINKQVSVVVDYEEDELELINRMVDIVRQFDPDIITGYEVHNSSWGYLIERARMKYEYNLCDELSRMKSQSHGRFGKDADRWGFTHTSTIRVTGRHMINTWRAMRAELSLLQYTMENVVFHLLHKRIPHYSHADLTTWYRSSKPRDLSKVMSYFISRVQLNIEILEANETIPRTSEQARLLGVDFFSVISRGSQFKIESIMFRIAKPENFILASPSRKQVGQQNALECLPLVMEPQSSFYSSPLVVLDFRSLYPSVMIAYNYCYSTCLGRIVNWRGRNKMGFMDFKREPQLLELVKDHVNIAPNGMMYVKPEMRKSLLAKMLGEILETRIMVKSGMKTDKEDRKLQQLLNNRQLALKLLANVTYGYTSASFSGRMPCSEVADSIVQTGRETLEKAIALIHSVERWGAEVVYGDTDSLFVHLKGRTRDQAFTIGEEIAEAVTKANPRPIKLNFEKVYHPCILLAKKRYVGFKYESRHQEEPVFDAKGIETVRRDGTPAEQKIEERALKILFRTSDLSQVKGYFQEQCMKIMSGRVSIQDFLFAREVKMGTYSDRGPPPPGALIATKRMLADPRSEPQYGERVPYVVITGAPGARLVDRCVSPEMLLQNDHIELDAEYYISKNLIPPLERIFNLVGANVRQWYDEMPKIQRIRNIVVPLNNANLGSGNALVPAAAPSIKKTLESYMKSSACIVCRSKLPPPSAIPQSAGKGAFHTVPLCTNCLKKPANSLLALKTRMWKNETRAKQIDVICRNCSNFAWGEEVRCDSRDCPVFYTRVRERSKLMALKEGVCSVIEMLEDEHTTDLEKEVDNKRATLEW
ncbi:hypothetical protein B0J11DRAFT_432216 [Dendryphion nanum]|uniref:DNA polymerase n=1 Tax=Dendryphion nanum TaxID=256645 RepID=A0A9P9DXC7_9PLEO|nr:hypothetical protein B0J11DRAFT_432216 [Dendryphion nanum]